jgi:L-fuconolactonase
MNIDAHFHAWQLDRADYGWLTPALGSIYRDVRVGDWWAQAAPLGVQGGVLVQAAPTAAETDFLLQQAAQHPQVLGVVGWVDLLAPDAPAQVQARAAQPRLKGLRPMLQDIEDTAWIAQAAVQPALAAMAACGLVFDALVQPRHLGVIAELAQRHPTLRIVVDHGAKPLMPAHGDGAQAFRTWREALQTLAGATEAERVMCKLSGLWTEAPVGRPCTHVQPWAEALLEVWGPERLIWGSDWPVLDMAGAYAPWHAFSTDLLAPYSPAQQRAVLGGNAQRMYRL